MVYNYEEMAIEYTKCYQDKTAIYFIEHILKTFNASKGKEMPFELFPKQKEFCRSLNENKNSIAIKPRQAGITTVSSAFVTHRIWSCDEGAPETVLCIGNKLDLAEQLITKIRTFLEQIPRWMWGEDFWSPNPDDPKNKKEIFIKRTKGELLLFNGCRVVARSSGENSARGISAVSFLIFDEASFIENGSEVYANAIAASSSVPNAKCVVVSTPNGKDQLYYRLYKGAQDKTNNFHVVEFRWYNDPRYNKYLEWHKKNKETGEEEIVKETIIDRDGSVKYDEEYWEKMVQLGYKPSSPWYEEMKKTFGNDEIKIAQELDVSFLGSSNNVISPEFIEMQRTYNVREPLEDFNDPLSKETWFWKKPIEGHRYFCACLPPGEKVMTENGLKNIEDITLQNKLIDKNGKETQILKLKRVFVDDENVYEIKLSNTYRTTKFTSEHPIWSSNKSILNRCYTKFDSVYAFNERYWSFDFKYNKVSSLQPGDWVEFPNVYFNKELSNNELLKISSEYGLPNGLILDETFWWFCGMWLAEGSFSKMNNRIFTSHHRDETEIKHKITNFVENVLSKHVCAYEIKNAQCTNLSFVHKEIMFFLENCFGCGAKNKHVKEWIKYIPNKLKYQMLYGYFLGDGCFTNNKRDGLIVKAASVSLLLMEDLQDILFSLGLVSSLVLSGNAKERYIRGRKVNGNKTYELSMGHVYGKEFLDNIGVENNSVVLRKHPINFCFFSKDKTKIYFKIKEINVTKHTGVVYNFETETHSFCTKNIATHNCDPSIGDSNDGTAIIIVDFDGRDENGQPIIEEVVEYYGKAFADESSRMLNDYCRLYNNALCIVENLGGYGEAIILNLQAMRYDNLYYEDKSIKNPSAQNTFNNMYINVDEKLPGFRTNALRLPMLSNLANMIRNNEIKIRSVRLCNQLDTWIFKDNGRMDHMNGAHDDLITCMGMTLYVLQFSFMKTEKQKSMDIAILNSYMTSSKVKTRQTTAMDDDVTIAPKFNMPFYTRSSFEPNRIRNNYMWILR
jgi:intein/homing endonuclease